MSILIKDPETLSGGWTRRQIAFGLVGLPLLPLVPTVRDDRLVIRDGWVLRASDLAPAGTA